MKDYRESHLDPDHAATYDTVFRQNPCCALYWRLEQRVLDRVLRARLADRPVRFLDFACGTGRIVSFLEDRVQEAVGVDISGNMLDIARRRVRKARLIQADLTRDDVLRDERFDLITAFRFFPNAQPPLRREVIEVLSRHLKEDGFLVFNNHLNLGSLFSRMARWLRHGGTKGMTQAEVHDFLDTAGLVIDGVYGIGFLPSTGRWRPLPAPLLAPVEACATRLGIFPGLAQDVIFVCRPVAVKQTEQAGRETVP